MLKSVVTRAVRRREKTYSEAEAEAKTEGVVANKPVEK